VLVVLPKRILELPPLSVEVLCPPAIALATKYTAAYVLGFNDEYAELRYEYMVDLRPSIVSVRRPHLPRRRASCFHVRSFQRGMHMTRKQDFWAGHIEAWQASGQTQTRYCREHQLSLPRFGYWRRKRKAATAAGSGKGMIPIVPPTAPEVVRIEIALGNGLTLRAPMSTEPARVAAWVQALGTC
ncbi:MAG: hypothetical protein L0H29_05605, partial [Sinobacteraceae bacterium]|nr:hypothetical protein [Nevskiaceae bacterium]